jgi:hypothetical protein
MGVRRENFFSGQMKSNENKASYMMELGEQSLADYFTKNAAELTDGRIWEVTREIALAMRDFHRGKIFFTNSIVISNVNLMYLLFYSIYMSAAFLNLKASSNFA